MSPIQTVEAIYDAFGKGDIPAILERLHPEVEWEYELVEHDIPWLAPRRGRAQVGEFFQSLQLLDFHHFEPVSLLEGPKQVAGIVRMKASVRASGKRIDDLEIHLFTFDDAGRVTRFRHFVDTHQHLCAARS